MNKVEEWLPSKDSLKETKDLIQLRDQRIHLHKKRETK